MIRASACPLLVVHQRCFLEVPTSPIPLHLLGLSKNKKNHRVLYLQIRLVPQDCFSINLLSNSHQSQGVPTTKPATLLIIVTAISWAVYSRATINKMLVHNQAIKQIKFKKKNLKIFFLKRMVQCLVCLRKKKISCLGRLPAIFLEEITKALHLLRIRLQSRTHK